MDKRIALIAGGLIVAAGAAAQDIQPCGPSNPVNQCFDQDTVGVESSPNVDDLFGSALAFGDFNGDGFDDLAVSAPLDDGAADDAGFVHVFYGSASGLVLTSGTDQFDRGELSGQTARARDTFGTALAAGDFDGDTLDDLAIGTSRDDHPGCGIAGCDDAGVIHVVYGTSEGLDLAAAVTLEEFGITGSEPTTNARLGAELGAGHLDDDGISDLAVCATGFGLVDDVPSQAGRCFRVFGAAGGLNQGSAAAIVATGETASQFLGSDLVIWDHNNNGFGQVAVGDDLFDGGSSCEDCGAVTFSDSSRIRQVAITSGTEVAGDRFGSALAVGHFDSDAFEDLAIGVPRRGPPFETGLVHVVFGESGGLDPTSLETQTMDQSLLSPAELEIGDQTGSALAAGDFDGDGLDDLAIGAPGDASRSGLVMLVFGGAGVGSLDLGRSERFLPNAVGGVAQTNGVFGSSLAVGDVNGDGRAELAIGAPGESNGAGRVYVHYFPAGAQIAATKSVSGSFQADGAVTYTVILRNGGVVDQPDDPAADEFIDSVPSQLTVSSATATDGVVTRTGNQIAWNGTIPFDVARTITIEATINAGTAGETVSNQGAVHFDADADGTTDTTILTDDPDTPAAALDPTTFRVFCGAAEDDLVLNVNVLDGSAVHEACSSISAGTLFEVGAEDDVTFRAGDRVVLRAGFRVLAGGSFTAVIDDP